MLDFVSYEEFIALINEALKDENKNQPYWGKETGFYSDGETNNVAEHNEPVLHIAQLLRHKNRPTVVCTTLPHVLCSKQIELSNICRFSFAGCTDLFEHLNRNPNLLTDDLKLVLKKLTTKENTFYLTLDIFSLQELKELEQTPDVRDDFKERARIEILNRLATTNYTLDQEDKEFIKRMLKTRGACRSIKHQHLNSFSYTELLQMEPHCVRPGKSFVVSAIKKILYDTHLTLLISLAPLNWRQDSPYLMEVISTKLDVLEEYSEREKRFIFGMFYSEKAREYISSKFLSALNLSELYSLLTYLGRFNVYNLPRPPTKEAWANYRAVKHVETEILRQLETKEPQDRVEKDKNFIRNLLHRKDTPEGLKVTHLAYLGEQEINSLLHPHKKNETTDAIKTKVSLLLAPELAKMPWKNEGNPSAKHTTSLGKLLVDQSLHPAPKDKKTCDNGKVPLDNSALLHKL